MQHSILQTIYTVLCRYGADVGSLVAGSPRRCSGVDGRPGIAAAGHGLTGSSHRQSAGPKVAAHHVATRSNRPPGSRRLAVQSVDLFRGTTFPFDGGFQHGSHTGRWERRDRSLDWTSRLTSTCTEIAARIESAIVVGTTAQHFILSRQWTVHPSLPTHEPAEDAVAAPSRSHASTADSDHLPFEEKTGLHVRRSTMPPPDTASSRPSRNPLGSRWYRSRHQHGCWNGSLAVVQNKYSKLSQED